MRSALLVLAAALTTLLAAEARADQCDPKGGVSTCVDADNLWPHAGGGRFYALGTTLTTPRGQLAFGLVGSFLKQPVGLRVASADPKGSTVYAVDDRFDASLLFALGVSDRLELTLAAPVTLYQSGAGLAGIVNGGEALPRSAVRDFRFGLSLALLSRPRVGEEKGPALTARMEFGAPLGTRTAFTGGLGATAVPSLVFDWRLGRVLVAAEAVARVRPEVPVAGATIGTQIGGSLGASVDVIRDRWLTVAAEAFALPTISAQRVDPRDPDAAARPLVPAEWIASVSTARLLGGDLVISVGGGGPIPITSGALTSPRYRLDFALRYAPTGRDTDGDGIPDARDRCPNDPEDRDGFQDDDGCPDPDNDGDGIPDVRDRCRDAAEDFDGHEDDDGCPELDDDGDGVPDDKDKCRGEPEDRDGFKDDDGCPDPDNDGDGILDAKDRCPDDAEDKDGFQDEDGCPELDNDRDGILDVEDQCPNDAEDKDGFQDKDGCPDPDDDEDGVPDAQDRCPREAETIDGVADDDGCPEPGARSLVKWEGDRVVLTTAPARFTPGKAELPTALRKQALMMATLARSRAPLGSVIVETYADRAGDASVKGAELAAARADAVKKLLIEAGIPAEVITAVAGDPGAKRATSAPPFDLSARRKARGRPAKLK